MNLVGSYAGPYYTGSSHAATSPAEFYGLQPNMGVSRYQWPQTHMDTQSPDPWTQQPAPTHSVMSTADHPVTSSHHETPTPLTLALNSFSMEHYQAQYNIPPAPNGYTNVPMYDVMADGSVKVRVVKRRNSANKKERRRTISINTAFSALRGCIPNVPSDTKLSKIKTLRLATSYIAYLMDILSQDDPTLTKGGFKADITKKIENREERRKREVEVRRKK